MIIPTFDVVRLAIAVATCMPIILAVVALWMPTHGFPTLMFFAFINNAILMISLLLMFSTPGARRQRVGDDQFF